jgi:hypothetical protein
VVIAVVLTLHHPSLDGSSSNLPQTLQFLQDTDIFDAMSRSSQTVNASTRSNIGRLEISGKVSRNTGPSVLNPDDRHELFAKQPSFGYLCDPAGLSIVTNDIYGLRDRDARAIRFAEKTRTQTLKRIRNKYNLDPETVDFNEGQRNEFQSVVEEALADCFEDGNENAEGSPYWSLRESHHFVVQDDHLMRELARNELDMEDNSGEDNDTAEDTVRNRDRVVPPECFMARERGQWTPRANAMERAMTQYAHRLRTRLANPEPQNDNDDASGTWASSRSEGGDDQNAVLPTFGSEDSDDEVWAIGEEADNEVSEGEEEGNIDRAPSIAAS